MPGRKLYFVSDAHLGTGEDSREREAELCKLLDKMREDAAVVVMLGDMFDFWFTYKHVVPRGYVRLLGSMARLADAGVELHYYVGNHDMWLFDYLESEMKITMHNDPDVLQFDGKKFLVGHGDGLGMLDKKYCFLRRVFRSKVNQRLFALLPQWMTFGIATGWSRQSRGSHIKHNPKIFEYQGDEKEGIVIYCKERLERERLDYCVFGHRHTPLVRVIESANGTQSTYVNVGDWLMNRNYAVYADGEMKLCEWPPAGKTVS